MNFSDFSEVEEERMRCRSVNFSLNHLILFFLKKTTSGIFVAYKPKGPCSFSNWEIPNFFDFNEGMRNG